MQKLWTEEDVSLKNLLVHMVDSGLPPTQMEEPRLLCHTESGIGYTVSLDADRKFIRFWSVLPLAPTVPYEQKLALQHHLNEDVFLPSFCLHDGGDLHISYVMTYQSGLIAGQFMSILRRFASVLRFVVEKKNDGSILLGAKHSKHVDELDESGSFDGPTDKPLLN